MREYVKKVHFVGVGGSGMSGIAEILAHEGYSVSGSDMAKSTTTTRLEKAGINVFYDHDASNVDDCDAIVRSTAIQSENIEIRTAREKNIPIVPRAEMLGELMRFREGIAVAGTHGKTTTTSIVAHVVAGAGLDPTFIVGGLVNSVNSNSRLGKGKHLIAEADESDASFLHLYPLISVVTNIDADHMDTYHGDMEGLKNTFVQFLHNIPFYGLAVLCADNAIVNEIKSRVNRPKLTYSATGEDADYRATNVVQNGFEMNFTAHYPNGEQQDYTMNMPGIHNVQNAMAAVVIADQLEISRESVANSLKNFTGVGRRFQNRGEIKFENEQKKGSFTLIEDYAHHPTELNAILNTVKDCWKDNRVIVVFQPHRYSRTRDLFDDFAQVLSNTHDLIITEVYSAGEPAISNADGRSLCKAIRARSGLNPIFVEDFNELSNVLQNVVNSGDVVVTLGAGSIGAYSAELEENGLI